MERQRSDDDSGVGSKEGAEGGRIRRWGHVGAEEGKIEIKGGGEGGGGVQNVARRPGSEGIEKKRARERGKDR